MNTSQHYITVIYRIFSDLLRLSHDIPACSRPFPYVLCLFLSVLSFSVVFLIILSSVPFCVFRLLLFIPLFRLVSFQFSILGSDRSESGSLPLIRLHFCSATIPFPIDLRVLLSFDHMTSVSPSNYDPFLIVLFCI